MRLLSGLFILAVASAALSQATPGKQPPFSLTLKATPSVESGSQVELTIVMKNLSNHDLNCLLCFSNGLDRAYCLASAESGESVLPVR